MGLPGAYERNGRNVQYGRNSFIRNVPTALFWLLVLFVSFGLVVNMFEGDCVEEGDSSVEYEAHWVVNDNRDDVTQLWRVAGQGNSQVNNGPGEAPEDFKDLTNYDVQDNDGPIVRIDAEHKIDKVNEDSDDSEEPTNAENRGSGAGIPAYNPNTGFVDNVDRYLENLEPLENPPEFIVFRAIGNDLPPRHELGQTRTNIKFVLEHEPPMPDNWAKWWVINRITEKEEEEAVIRMLEEHNQQYINIPFVLEDFAKLDFRFQDFSDPEFLYSSAFADMDDKWQALAVDHIYQEKNKYVMHNNGARNIMLRAGKKLGATYILPFDGNCFFTKTMMSDIEEDIHKYPHTKYFVTPMARYKSNEDLVEDKNQPAPNQEPQIIFRWDSEQEFDEQFRYGRRPKVEMLVRLRVKGPWDNWPTNAWESKCNGGFKPLKKIKPNDVKVAGWIARMYSGRAHLEDQIVDRGISRYEGIQRLLDKQDQKWASRVWDAENLFMYNEDILSKEKEKYRSGSANEHLSGLLEELRRTAEDSLKHGPFSVVNKNKAPPSNDKHDYYNPAPYFWPNPETADGMPYVWRDGERVPGTELYGEGSDDYDRTRLQSFYGNTTALALGWYFFDVDEYAVKAAENIKVWFVDEETRMNPRLIYSQIRWGHNGNVGSASGVIETKDFYFVLDAVRLIHRSGNLEETDMEAIHTWCANLLKYLQEEKQGKSERGTNNNHGTFYDLQTASLAAFINDLPTFLRIVNWSKMRIAAQFEADGSMPHELKRTTSFHYAMFALHGWYCLARYAEGAGVDLWNYSVPDREEPIFKTALKWIVPYYKEPWERQQIDPIDIERVLPLYYMGVAHYPEIRDDLQAASGPFPPKYAIKPRFFEHNGIHLFWNLGLNDVEE
eukprot:Clim_evm85s11 gene=Clim_evmTU85s11